MKMIDGVNGGASASLVLCVWHSYSSGRLIRRWGIGHVRSTKDGKQDPDVIQGFCQLEIYYVKQR
jgi:hypothetical protein